jgi:transcription initiation factor IIE alpha subunit
VNHVEAVQVFKAIIQGPVSRIALAKQIGANPKVVGKLLAEMKNQKMIHVIDYSNETDGRNRVKIYTLGDGVDAEPRRSQSQEERSRKSYVKKVRAIKQANIKTTFVGGKSLWQ